MAFDLFALGMKIETKGYTEGKRALQDLDREGQRTDRTVKKLSADMEVARERFRAAFVEVSKGTRATQAAGGAFQQLANDVRLASADFRAGMLSAEGYATAIHAAQMEARSLRNTGVIPMGAELTAFNRVMGATARTTGAARVGLGTIRNSLGSLAATTIGASGRFGALVSTMLFMTAGNLAAIGIIGGLALVAAGIGRMTKASREAKAAVAELIRELNKAKDAALGLDLIQQRTQLEAEVERRRQAAAQLRRAGASAGQFGVGGVVESQAMRDATAAITEAERALAQFNEQTAQAGPDLSAYNALVAELDTAMQNLGRTEREVFANRVGSLPGVSIAQFDQIMTQFDRLQRMQAQLDALNERRGLGAASSNRGEIGLRFTTPERVEQAPVNIVERMSDDTLEAITDFRNRVGAAFTDAIIDAFQAPGNFAENLSRGLLGGIGRVMVDLGQQMVITGIGIGAFVRAVRALSGVNAIAAGAGLIVVGSLLVRAASGAGERALAQSGVGGGGGFTAQASGVDSVRYSLNPITGAVNRATTARPNVNLTVIGPNDPAAARDIMRLIQNATRRGYAVA